MKIIISIILLISFSYSLISQDIIGKILYYHKTKIIDTAYIKEFDRKITLAMNLEHKSENFRIYNTDGSGRKIFYEPNIAYKLGFTASKNGIRLTFTIPIPQYTHIYGKSKAFAINLKTQTSMMNWGYELDFARYSGLFVNNPSQVVSGWKYGTTYPQRTDFKITKFAFNTHIVLSKKVSLKAAFMQTEAQKKSAGGVVLGFGMNYSGFSADSGIITSGQLNNYGDIIDLKRGGFWNINFVPGYVYSWVYQDFYVSGIIGIGLGPQFKYYKNELIPKFKFGIGAYPTAKLAIGYNTQNYFAAFIYETINNAYEIEDSKINFIAKNMEFTAGIRLK